MNVSRLFSAWMKGGHLHSHQGWLNLATREAGHWVPANSLITSG